jgi:hypothetical protein|tara:strand:- start:145 stop:474 length:330 start_codon:yes stop_codon:yes gene_type:complete
MLGFAPLADNSIAGFGNVPVDTAVTGVAGTGAVGTVGVKSEILVTGVAGTSAVGTITVIQKHNISVTGVAGTGLVGVANVWGRIIPSQNSQFSAITPSQTPSWTNIIAG